jgi:hypothetical protein
LQGTKPCLSRFPCYTKNILSLVSPVFKWYDYNSIKTPTSGRLDLPCGQIGGGFAAARQAKLAANAPKREFHTTFVGGQHEHDVNSRHLKFTPNTNFKLKSSFFSVYFPPNCVKLHCNPLWIASGLTFAMICCIIQ